MKQRSFRRGLYAVVLVGAGIVTLGAGLSPDARGDQDVPAPLRVATFQSDVTLPLGQVLYSKPVVKVEHPLMAKGIVLDDGQHRYVLCAVDWCTIRNSTYDLFRSKLAAAVAADVSRVAVQCVHQHTAPSYDGEAQKLLNKEKDPPRHRDLKFLDEVTSRLGAAAKESLKRLEPVDQIGTGQAKVERVASYRRLPDKDGKIRMRWSACTDPKLRAEPEGPIDPMLKTITFARGGKPIVRLHYYATHPQSFYGDGRTSYDVPGIARERLEKKEGVFQMYFTGCSGDVAMGKYNDRTPRARAELAERLYAGMAAAAASTRLVPLSPLGWRTVPVQFAARTDGGRDPAANRAKMADPKAPAQDRVRAASRVACAERLKRPIELSSLQIGKVYILHLPGEPMVEFQRFAQESLPGAFVAVAGYGCGTPGYICTERSFKEGGYEPSASAVVPASEKVFREAIVRLLGE